METDAIIKPQQLPITHPHSEKNIGPKKNPKTTQNLQIKKRKTKNIESNRKSDFKKMIFLEKKKTLF